MLADWCFVSTFPPQPSVPRHTATALQLTFNLTTIRHLGAKRIVILTALLRTREWGQVTLRPTNLPGSEKSSKICLRSKCCTWRPSVQSPSEKCVTSRSHTSVNGYFFILETFRIFF